MRQRARQPGLAAAGGSGDQQALPVAQPVAAGQRRDQRLVQRARLARQLMSSTHAVLTFSLAALSSRAHAPVIAPGHLALHQQRQALLEAQRGGRGAGGLVLDGAHHAVQAQAAQLVDRVFVEHR
jgi:hypothetical protein